MGIDPALQAHLDAGTTTLCQCWRITRKDGWRLGFTDHDRDLVFDGTIFRADTGLSADALAQSTGLAVDNTEAIGGLSDAAIRESDIRAGRFDGAAVEAWLVNWSDVGQRSLRFRGSIGEIQTGGGGFRAELRGLSDILNRPSRRLFQSQCAAVLGDAACGVDLAGPSWRVSGQVVALHGVESFTVAGLGAYEPGWFDRGTCRFLDGAAAALQGRIKTDHRKLDGSGLITLWEAPRAAVAVGDTVELVAGCDRRLSTCRDKFDNAANFRGFPHMPGDDWMVAHPSRGGRHDGGRRK